MRFILKSYTPIRVTHTFWHIGNCNAQCYFQTVSLRRHIPFDWLKWNDYIWETILQKIEKQTRDVSYFSTADAISTHSFKVHTGKLLK